ncbi:MAG: hypothetical protein M5U28_42185 [Sandaracinaceae bacterium]|nr:hypothetical protein [Sandaracinaceae bacterium]
MLGGLGKLLGARDVVLGDDPAFDERFVVKCDDEGATRAAWTHRARRLLFAVDDARVESDGSTVSVVVGGHREDASTLEALLDLAGELASYGARELAAAAELPGARWIGPAGPWDRPRAPRVELESARGPIAVRCLPAAGATRAPADARERARAPHLLGRPRGRAARRGGAARAPPRGRGGAARAGR